MQGLLYDLHRCGKHLMAATFDFIYEITESKSVALYAAYVVYLLFCWWTKSVEMWLYIYRRMFYKSGYWRDQKILFTWTLIKYIPFWGRKHLEKITDESYYRDLVISKYGSVSRYVDTIGIIDWLTVNYLFFYLYDRLWQTGNSGGYLLCLESMERISKSEAECYSKRSPVCLLLSLLMFKRVWPY